MSGQCERRPAIGSVRAWCGAPCCAVTALVARPSRDAPSGCCAAAVPGSQEFRRTPRKDGLAARRGYRLAFQGTPYRAAGADPSGFDCSGLIQYVFWQHGVALPRDVAEQFRAGRQVDDDRIQPGDLVFFTDWAGRVTRGYRRRRWGIRARAESTGVVRVESLAGAVLGDAIRRRTARRS